MRIAALVLPSFLLLACAAKPEPSVERVQVLSAAQKERQCKSLGTFTVEQRGGPDKPGAALNKAVSEVTRRGGNGIYVTSNTVDWEAGATVSAEALQCQF